MGETKFAQSQTSQACQETIEQCTQTLDQGTRVHTPGGVFEVQWSNEGKATAIGQLAPKLPPALQQPPPKFWA